MNEKMTQETFDIEQSNAEQNKGKIAHYVKNHDANDYLVDALKAIEIVKSIVGRETGENSLYHAAQDSSRRLMAEGKYPCMIIVRHVVFYSRQYVEDWAKAYKAKFVTNAANARNSTDARVADIIKKMEEMQREIDRLKAEK